MTDKERAAIGRYLAEVLQLRHDRDHPDRYPTTWGTKTDVGLYNTIYRIIHEAIGDSDK